MPRRRSCVGVTMVAFAICGGGLPPAVYAQTVEIAPFGGFRFGSALVDTINGRPIDVDGAPAVGLVVDVPLSSGMQIEGAFSHQRASVFVPN
ncbi:MAG TPA: hypothetical protein VH138_00375, partial [Vicinamibacterales bacterium]|nr:hypothetical protein [Vicinamibacterales bacterium]